jgi:hypothetical protein
LRIPRAADSSGFMATLRVDKSVHGLPEGELLQAQNPLPGAPDR